jgi:hypothetical protein
MPKLQIHNDLEIKREVSGGNDPASRGSKVQWPAAVQCTSRGSKVQWRHNNSQPKSGTVNNTSPQ